MEFLFQHVPVSINGNGKVESVTFKTPAGEKTFKCGLVISAIGYVPKEAPGVPLESGKVLNADGFVEDNMYVVGWAKRGPSGVIGTNKSDAADVMKLLVEDLKNPKSASDIADILPASKVISQSHWEAINAAEVAAGEPLGKPRVKAVTREELLSLGGI